VRVSRDEPVRRGHQVSRRSARRARSLVVVVAAGAAALDQVGKRVLAVHEAGAVLGPVHVVLTHNPGLAFGTLAGHPGLARLIDLGTSVLLLVLGIRLSRETSAGTRVLWGLLLGGALGNAVDRFGSAGVVDWLRVAGYPAAFNLSDVFVRMSGVGLATLLLRHGSGTARGGEWPKAACRASAPLGRRPQWLLPLRRRRASTGAG